MTSEANLVLTADQQAVAQKKIRDIHGATSTIFSLLKEGKPVDAELARNCVKVAEFNLADLCKALGVETDSAQEREDRYARLRAANMEIRDLQAQLGMQLSPEATQESIKNIATHLNKWWDLDGFGFIRDLEFGQYGVCKSNFSCSLNGAFRLIDSDTPVTDKEHHAAWIESLRSRGFDLVKDDRDWSILDSDASRKALIDLFAARLPSAKVVKFENFCRHRAGGFVLRSAEVYIYKIAEILTLPVPTDEQESARPA